MWRKNLPYRPSLHLAEARRKDQPLQRYSSGYLLRLYNGSPAAAAVSRSIREIAEPLWVFPSYRPARGHSLPHLTLPWSGMQSDKSRRFRTVLPRRIPFLQAPGGTPELRSSLRFSRCNDLQEHSLENPGYLVLRLFRMIRISTSAKKRDTTKNRNPCS